ncbi:MAG: NlpC/P60 family protein [Betaproteobacteria bacterium]|nr:NlpC/P60 family protein [Betaproteobacteria bacterium]
MKFDPLIFLICALCALCVRPVLAGEAPGELPAAVAQSPSLRLPSLGDSASDRVRQAGGAVQNLVDGALELVGIRYRRGGNSAEAGFDCSGLVVHVFRESLGILLPRTSREISRAGAVVGKAELAPGDLVFFNTRRNAFSHVGIYLGDDLFVHAPRPGQRVRIEDMRARYWAARFNGARRVEGV